MPTHMPGGDAPQLPPTLVEKFEQLKRLSAEIQRELAGIAFGPRGDTPSPAWPPVPQEDFWDVVDAIYGPDDRDRLRWRSGMRISGVEMTQSVQYYDLHGQGSKVDSDNAVPLVAGKDLILRAYVELQPGSLFGSPDQFSGSATYRGKLVKPLNGPRPLQADTSLKRPVINDSLNFRIPAADCRGRVNFTVQVYEWQEARVYLDPSKARPSYHRASYTITADFQEIPAMKITGVLFALKQPPLVYIGAPSAFDLVATMARFLPMLPTPSFHFHPCVVQEIEGGVGTPGGWNALLNVLANLRSASTERSFYVGLLSDLTGSLPLPQRGIGRTGLAIAAKNDTRALSHELGHACSQDHVDVNSPPPPHDPKYPNYGNFPFGSVGETGIDAARLKLYDPASSYDYMTYNENGSKVLFTANTWISPYNYTQMMRTLVRTDGSGDFVLLWVVLGGAMLLNFRVHRGARVEVLPSYPVTGVPATHDRRAHADVMLDLYDRDGGLIDSYRCHQHNPYQDPDGAYVDYHEVLPWSDNVGEIVLARERTELARLPVGSNIPKVQLEKVRRVEHNGSGDLARVEWATSDSQGQAGPTSGLVRYSHDGGRTWRAVAADLRDTSTVVNLDQLPGGDDCRFEVVVSSGLSASVAQSESFAVRRKLRQVQIVSPQNGQTFRVGEPVVFAGGSHSPDFGTSPSSEVSWTSSLGCCAVGTGAYFVRDDLEAGTHRVTLMTPDGGGGDASASIWINVQAVAAG